MAPDASTRPKADAKALAMRRPLLIVVLLGLIAVVVGLFVLGEFPPQPQPKQVEKVLPNDRFQSH
jgi:hypothetical protein